MNKDKQIEYRRYEEHAARLLSLKKAHKNDQLGSAGITPILRTPYLYYEMAIQNLVRAHHHVLELGAGSGMHTLALAKTKAKVVATDISPSALKLLENNVIAAGETIITEIADIESLPFADSSFDVVVCAGSLSYGDPAIVDKEIYRVLRPQGTLICVDSLSHNPIYRLNRWIGCFRGLRTKSTLRFMPRLSRIERLSSRFCQVEMHYFGALTYIMPFVAILIGKNVAQKFSDWIDRFVRVKRAAFKFVIVATAFKKQEII